MMLFLDILHILYNLLLLFFSILVAVYPTYSKHKKN